MRKRSLTITIALIFSMLFAVGLPSVSAQVGVDCHYYDEGPHYVTDASTIYDYQFSLLGQNQTWYVTSPDSPNQTVNVTRYNPFTVTFTTFTTTLPAYVATSHDSFTQVSISTDDGSLIDWVVLLTCGVEYLSCPIDDGRLDTSDCGALVAAYPNGTVLDIYGIDPASGEGVLVFSFDLATAGDVTENTLLAEGVNPFNGQPIRLYKLVGGGYQLNSTQPNGEPYTFTWS